MGYQLSYLALTKRFSDYETVQSFRNNLVHSTNRQSESELRRHLAKVEELIKAASDELAKPAPEASPMQSSAPPMPLERRSSDQ